MIYTCRLGEEEIPAVQILEAADENGQVTATIARAAVGDGIEIKTPGVAATWDFKSIAARSGDSLIKIAFDPDGARKDEEWILTLADENNYFKSRVRDCTEVSDE